MKVGRRSFLLTILFCSFAVMTVSGCKKSGEFSGPINSLKRYPYQRFHLAYEYKGDVRGTEDLYISDYGNYEARHSKFEIISAKEIHSIDNGSISRLSDVFAVDYLQKTAIHEHVQFLDSLYHLDVSDIPSPQTYLEIEMKKNYFKEVGTDTIAGKRTTKWQQIDGNLTLWIWNGLLLRKHATSETGSLEMIVTSIDTLWSVDTTKFSVPSGFIIKEAEKNKHAPNPN